MKDTNDMEPTYTMCIVNCCTGELMAVDTGETVASRWWHRAIARITGSISMPITPTSAPRAWAQDVQAPGPGPW